MTRFIDASQLEHNSWQARTAAHLQNARKHTARLGGKKSRTGCNTCRLRKVKCDETRPACRRCQTGGRQCEGYRSFSGLSAIHARPLTSVATTPFLALPDRDKRQLDFYISCGASRLAGSLDRDFWTRDILQLAHFESCVLDSLLAISTLYEHPQYLERFSRSHPSDPSDQDEDDGKKATVVLSAESEEGQSPPDQHHAAALHAYNRAIAKFRQRLEDGKASPLLALVSCVLFICIEVIRDDVYAALGLFSKSTGLLQQFEGQAFTNDERRLVTAVKLMLDRMGVLAAAFGHPRPQSYTPDKKPGDQLRRFKDMHDARNALFSIMADGHDFVRNVSSYRAKLFGNTMLPPTPSKYEEQDDRRPEDSDINLASSEPIAPESNVKSLLTPDQRRPEVKEDRILLVSSFDGMHGEVHCACDGGEDMCAVCYTGKDYSDPIPRISGRQRISDGSSPESDLKTLQAEQNRLETRLRQWRVDHAEMCEFVESQRTDAVSSLMLYFHTSHIWLSTRLTLLESSFDDHTAHFEEVLRHAEIYITSKEDERLTFTFEVGAIPPLYFTATKCRVPSIRRQALRLLARAPRKEAMWGATSTGQIAARLMAIEEEGLGLTPPAWDGKPLYPGGAMVQDQDMDSRLPAEDMRIHHLQLLVVKATRAHEMRVCRSRLVNGELVEIMHDFAI
ncbi:hypothetical protein LTR78_006792 [Recurvomyces mirabilis]|uniref:Zn(2)-C6 fungal-type domain-containing protein n=1 Tax=Recurvomyces mirabilis TaxID=574656 RepID=A0AAE0WK87_9PEZI|nr:hypothetical protein LTR78_006792 [Recurvomyces mirabilis]KAK5153218.1 hypothetical protein LTS14_007863 [Recurvomyces mirabilis]